MANDIQIYLNNFFDEYGFSDKKIGVALSGGRDSVALAYALKKGGYDVVAINVEHGIRGENSLKDSAFVRDFAKNTILCFIKRESILCLLRATTVTPSNNRQGYCDIESLKTRSKRECARWLLLHIIKTTKRKLCLCALFEARA